MKIIKILKENLKFILKWTFVFALSVVAFIVLHKFATVEREYNAIGGEIYYDGENWRYIDNDEIENDMRPCKICGRMPTAEGYDACLGHIDGVKSACCGHGVEEPYFVKGGEINEI